jgi:hypothetical protein
LLVDVDIYYDATRVSNIDFRETTNEFKKSPFTKSATSSWHGQLKASCGRVNVTFDYLGYKKKSKSGDLVLAATFLYRFKNGAEEKPSDKKLHLCINATREMHEEYLEKFTWLSSIPALKGKNGENVEALAAPYDNNVRYCCVVKRTEMTCCPDGAIFVPGEESSSCGKGIQTSV